MWGQFPLPGHGKLPPHPHFTDSAAARGRRTQLSSATGDGDVGQPCLSTAFAAANRAIGTRNGEQET